MHCLGLYIKETVQKGNKYMQHKEDKFIKAFIKMTKS